MTCNYLEWISYLWQCQRPLVRVLVITNTSKTTADKSNGHCLVWMDSLWVYNRLFYFRSNAAKPQFMAVIIPRSQDRPCFKVLGFVLAFIGKTHASVNLPKVIRNTQPLQNKKKPLGNPNKSKKPTDKTHKKSKHSKINLQVCVMIAKLSPKPKQVNWVWSFIEQAWKKEIKFPFPLVNSKQWNMSKILSLTGWSCLICIL